MGEAQGSKVVYLRLDDIIPNRFQPREIFDEPGLEELSNSIKEHGVIQPIVVREMGGKYELIAGERRTKASALAGLTTIPAIIKNMDDKESAKVSLLENLQRKNLSAIEEARTYKKIIELDNLTQEELARTMGKSQPMVANKLRLLMLPDEVQDALMKNQISERHARSLLTLKNKKSQLAFLDKIRNERLTVRELDKELKKYREEHSDDESGDNAVKELENDNLNIRNEEENERSFMNNNRGNFGSMGLNDYQSGISGNMYNNLPNNFSNIPNANNNGASPYNYNNFDDNTINNTNNTMNSYFNEMQSSSSVNPNTTSSLGSMFDGYNNAPVNVPESTNQDSNLFVSHIREDNLPKTENQFLPNFDNFNQTDNFNNEFNNLDNQAEFNNMPNNAFNDLSANNNEPTMDTSFNDINNQNDNGNYNPAFDNQNMDTNYADYNNFNNMGNMLPRDSMNNQNQNYFMNDLNSGMNPGPMGVNNNVGMNGFGNNNSNYNNNFGAPIPDNGGMTTMYQPNQGSMFSQPLNLVDVPNNNSFENTIPTESNTPSLNSFENNLEQMSNSDFSSSNNGDSSMEEMPVNNEENYNDMMFSQPVSMGGDIEETNDEFGNDNSAFVSDSASQEIPEINPSYDTPITEENNNFKEREELNSQSNNQDYINLDPVYTLKTPLDAVLELKKTTDAIKQNNIDIETEEIDFDDVYQIIIKIKKTDDII